MTRIEALPNNSAPTEAAPLPLSVMGSGVLDRLRVRAIAEHANAENPLAPTTLSTGSTWTDLADWIVWADDMEELCTLYTEGDLWIMIEGMTC